jgi:protein-tyrosine phosphatase
MIEGLRQWWQMRAQMRAVALAHKQSRAVAVAQAAAGPTEDSASLRVLMVCMGNVCRSPIAEGVLRAKLHAAGLGAQVLVDSAGTHGYHTQEPPDARSIRIAAQRGYDIAGQRARPVVPEDFSRFDLLLAMDSSNLAWLQKRKPEDTQPRIELLLSHSLSRSGLTDVPDPYYGADTGFEVVMDLVEDACDGLVAQLRGELNLCEPVGKAVGKT